MHRTLSSTAVLAVKAMIDLALQSQTGPVALAVIARRQGISMSYMDQLFGKLRRCGLVRSTRGPGGGYALGRDAAEISVADIVVAVAKSGPEGGRSRARTPKAGAGGDQGLALDIWSELDAKLIGWFGAISLKALLGDRLVPASGGARPASIGIASAPRPPVPVIDKRVPNSVFALAGVPAARTQWAR